MHSIVESASAGLVLFLAGVLMIAAAIKFRAPQPFERTLVALLPRGTWRIPGLDSRRLALLVSAVEGGGGVALLLTPPHYLGIVGAAVFLVFATFLVATTASVVRKVHCGCFGASRGPAGASEMWRSGVLLAAAAAIPYGAVAAPDLDLSVRSVGPPSLVAMTALCAAAFGPQLVVRRRPRTAPPREAGRGVTDRSRRTVLHGLGLGALTLGGIIILPPPAPNFGFRSSCQERYDRCYGCDPAQNRCCIECYVICAGGGSPCTPWISCGGCWPPARS